MNQVFSVFLDQFVIVFIDDNLIFSPNHETYIDHLRIMLEMLRTHYLFGKLSKCTFWLEEVIFLGHVISAQGEVVDPSKVEVVINWSRPKSVSEVWGFLG